MNLHELKYQAIQDKIKYHQDEIKRLNGILPDQSFHFTLDFDSTHWIKFKEAFVMEFKSWREPPPDTFTEVEIRYYSDYVWMKFWFKSIFMGKECSAEQVVEFQTVAEVDKILQGY